MTLTSDAPPPTPPRRLGRRLGIGGLIAGGLGFLGASGAAFATRGRASAPLEPRRLRDPSPVTSQTLRVMCFNVAHGRAESFHQALLRTERIRRNLEGIGEVLRRERPDLVGLQEADGPSWWSGRFDHVAHLAELGEQALAIRAANVDGAGLSYGAAVLSQLPCPAATQTTFPPSPPTPAKGFVRGTFRWQPEGRSEPLEVVFISVHLDFSRQSVRERQLALLGAAVPEGAPCVLLGDFNCGWDLLGPWATKLGLSAHEPDAKHVTFPSHGRRLDWILISDHFERVEQRILPDRWSDHLALVADLRLR